MDAWDYIIVGAGSAGCVLANRLSADPSVRVLLLEAGGSDKALKYNIVALGALAALGHEDSDWMLPAEPDPSRDNKVELLPRGKVLGGSSAINGTIYVRGNRGDYDHWAQLGNRGWDYDSLVKVFRRMEDAQGDLASSSTYGHGGPMKISAVKGAHPLAYKFLEGMRELGVPTNADYNGEEQTGASLTHVTQRRGWRWSSARGYLHPAMSRPNLRVMTGVLARRVLFDGKRAVGVELEQDGEVRIERCSGEVILSASAFNSPKLLMLSGIGDPETLGEHGIDVVHANPHVGKNLQEHPYAPVKAHLTARTQNLDVNLFGMLRTGARFAFTGGGAATYVFPAISFVKLRPESEYPDLQFHFGAFIADITDEGVKMHERGGITLMPGVNRSQSRGYVSLKSSDPRVPPLIQSNMLGSQYDVDTIVAGVKMARRLLRTKAFAPLFAGEYVPGEHVADDQDIEAYVRASAMPSYHASGSAKMGVDAAAVVDPDLRVIGVEGLRVVDSSIIPQVPCGNINAVSILIGEKGSDAILAARRGQSIVAGTASSAR